MRDFNVTDPKCLKALEEIRVEMDKLPQSYWDNQMKKINDMCKEIADSQKHIGAGSGDMVFEGWGD